MGMKPVFKLRHPWEKPVFYGLYNLYGYQIIEKDSDGTPVYSAGNSPHESQTYVCKADGLPIEKIAEMCRQTGREIAQEKEGIFDGCTYDKDAESEYAFLEKVEPGVIEDIRLLCAGIKPEHLASEIEERLKREREK